MANFSPVSRAEISPRPPEQIFLKRRLRLHGQNFSPVSWAEISPRPPEQIFFQPGLVCETGLGFSTRAEIQKNLI